MNRWIRFCMGVLIGFPTVLLLLWLLAMLGIFGWGAWVEWVQPYLDSWP